MFKPVPYGIIVKVTDEEMSKGGLYIPERHRERTMPTEGTIEYKGKDVTLAEIGENWVFGQYAAKKLTEECEKGFKYVFIMEGDLLYKKCWQLTKKKLH